MPAVAGGGGGGGARNMNSIFFMTYFHRAGGGGEWLARPPGSAVFNIINYDVQMQNKLGIMFIISGKST